MTARTLLLLPGDGIGPEAMAEVRKIIAYMNAELGAGFTTDEGLVGGSAYDAHGAAISERTRSPDSARRPKRRHRRRRHRTARRS